MLSPFKRVSLAKSPNSAYKAQHRIRPRALRCLDLLRRHARLTPWKRRWQSRRLKDEPCEWRERRRNEIDPEDSVPAEDVARRLKQRGLGDQNSRRSCWTGASRTIAVLNPAHCRLQ